MQRLGGLRKLVIIALVAVGVAWLPVGAEATISYSLDFIFSGQQPGNTGPWGTISFTTVGSDTLVTMTALNGATGLAAGEFITFWGFNTTDTSFGVPGTVSGAASGTIAVCADPCSSAGFKADGDGFYNIVVSFTDANDPGRLTAGETVAFTVTGALEGSFNDLSAPGGGNGTYNSAIHIQGIPTNCSAWVGNSTSPNTSAEAGAGAACGTVPEAGGLALVASGLLSVGGLIGTRFRSRSRNEA